MATLVPLSGSVLAWAMVEAGMDEDHLATAVGVDPSSVTAWISGESLPKTGEFRKVAKALNRPTVFFLQSEAPASVGIPASFRRFADSGNERQLLPEEDKALRVARRMQTLITWLRENQNEDEPSLPLFDSKTSPSDAASAYRAHLSWDIDTQVKAATTSKALSALRLAVENQGVLVMLLSMKRDGARGFALYDSMSPLCAINSAQTMEARLFTLMHEVGHIARGQTAMDPAGAVDAVRERWCDRFAAAFLLPAEPLSAFINRTFAGGVVTLGDARRVANRFHVSLAASCIRIAELKLGADLYHAIPEADHLRAVSEGGFNPDPSTAGKRLREYGLGIIRPILDAEEAQLLRRHDIQRYLKVDDSRFNDLSTRVGEIAGNNGTTDYDDE